MSDTIKKQIRTAALAALNGAGKPVGVPATVIAGTSDPPVPSIRLYQVEDPAKKVGGQRGPIVRRELTLAIEARAAVTEGTDPYDGVEAMEAWILVALGGLGIPIPRVAHEFAESKTTYLVGGEAKEACLATIFYKVSYQTRADDATAWD